MVVFTFKIQSSKHWVGLLKSAFVGQNPFWHNRLGMTVTVMQTHALCRPDRMSYTLYLSVLSGYLPLLLFWVVGFCLASSDEWLSKKELHKLIWLNGSEVTHPNCPGNDEWNYDGWLMDGEWMEKHRGDGKPPEAGLVTLALSNLKQRFYKRHESMLSSN